MRRFPPALALLLLAPAVGELLSSSAPPSEFFHPFGFPLLVGLYGSGAIIVRELTLRWGKGKATLLLMGAAYGIIEEGLMVKSFFDPGWMDLGPLGVFGRWLGVNWVWTLYLTLYHAVFSITIPVVLVELAYPERKNKPWVGRRGFWSLAAAFAFVVVFGFVFLTSYFPAAHTYALTVLAVALIVYLAYRTPAHLGYRGTGGPRRPSYWWLLGLVGSVLLFGGLYAGPSLVPNPPLLILASVAILVLYADRLRRGSWLIESPLSRLALAAGGLTPMIIIAFLTEFDGSRPDNPAGMSFVAAGFVLFLALLWRHVSRRAPGGPTSDSARTMS